MKTTKKKVSGRIPVFLLILALIVTMIPAMPTEAASQKAKAIAAYKKMLSKSTVTVVPREVQYRRRRKVYEPAKASNVKFSIAYIDNDSVPELILVDSKTGYCGIWTFRSGKVENLEFFLFDKPFGYYRKKGVFRIEYSSSSMYEKEYHRIFKGKSEEVLFAMKEKGDASESYYCITSGGASKKISRKAFDAKLKALVGNTSLTRFVMRSNTASNRKKYLK